MITRRDMLAGSAFAVAATTVREAQAKGQKVHARAPAKQTGGAYTPVQTLNGSTLPFVMKDGVKEFHLIAEPVLQTFAPGMKVQCWGYNGSTPGPTIEAVEGDRIRILVENRLPEATTVHWHGLFLPSGMDGVGGLSQPAIQPGETWVYEFPLINAGTFMYHPHADEMVQMAVGMMGMFIVHPRVPERPNVDRDFVIMAHEWSVHPGTARVNPSIMLDFNTFTFNGKVFPAIDPLVVKTGERVRVRFGNLSMDQHPMHLHGYRFHVTATDGGKIPPSARWPQTTVPVPVGSTRDIEFVADVPGDWAFHCHKSHHTMNAMGHDLPVMMGADTAKIEKRIQTFLPAYMRMGENGMAEMQPMSKHMRGPDNTLPMMMGDGPHGPLEMGGMFTILKVRDRLEGYADPGWYPAPPGTTAYKLK